MVHLFLLENTVSLSYQVIFVVFLIKMVQFYKEFMEIDNF